MENTAKERVLSICTELGEDLESENCVRLREFVQTCPNCAAFVDSVKKTILLYQAYQPEFSETQRDNLLTILKLK